MTKTLNQSYTVQLLLHPGIVALSGSLGLWGSLGLSGSCGLGFWVGFGLWVGLCFGDCLAYTGACWFGILCLCILCILCLCILCACFGLFLCCCFGFALCGSSALCWRLWFGRCGGLCNCCVAHGCCTLNQSILRCNQNNEAEQ